MLWKKGCVVALANPPPSHPADIVFFPRRYHYFQMHNAKHSRDECFSNELHFVSHSLAIVIQFFFEFTLWKKKWNEMAKPEIDAMMCRHNRKYIVCASAIYSFVLVTETADNDDPWKSSTSSRKSQTMIQSESTSMPLNFILSAQPEMQPTTSTSYHSCAKRAQLWVH